MKERIIDNPIEPIEPKIKTIAIELDIPNSIAIKIIRKHGRPMSNAEIFESLNINLIFN